MSSILVTGGAGYIGSQTCLNLKQNGYQVIILDDLSTGHQDFINNVLKVPFFQGNCGNEVLLREIFNHHSIEAVVHFAASAYVGESSHNPLKYYQNNVVNTLVLLKAMLEANIKNIIFSSTCATYGIPEKIPIMEEEEQIPINPYGTSKLTVERIIKDFEQAYGLRFVIFRYFNAAGADPNGLLGEDHNPEPHLIPSILLTALGKRSSFNLYGNDYPTHDGTCIRDYIHVQDIARAHVLGLSYLLETQNSQIFNLSNGNGFSILDIIKEAQNLTKFPIKTNISPRRLGDPPVLIGNSEKANKILGWQPEYSQLSQIISHAWQWHQKRHL